MSFRLVAGRLGDEELRHGNVRDREQKIRMRAPRKGGEALLLGVDLVGILLGQGRN